MKLHLMYFALSLSLLMFRFYHENRMQVIGITLQHWPLLELGVTFTLNIMASLAVIVIIYNSASVLPKEII